jgi:hypothetical protein
MTWLLEVAMRVSTAATVGLVLILTGRCGGAVSSCTRTAVKTGITSGSKVGAGARRIEVDSLRSGRRPGLPGAGSEGYSTGRAKLESDVSEHPLVQKLGEKALEEAVKSGADAIGGKGSDSDRKKNRSP